MGIRTPEVETASSRYQNRVIVELATRRGQAMLAGLVDQASRDRLRACAGGPAIFIGWHVGPPFGVMSAFQAAGVDLLIVRRAMQGDATATSDFASIDGGRSHRSAAFRRSVARVREAGPS